MPVDVADHAFQEVAASCGDLGWLERNCQKIKRWRRGTDGGHIREALEAPLGAEARVPGSALVFDRLHSTALDELLRRFQPAGRGRPTLMQANGILAAPGYQCAVHFDAQSIVTLQVLGEKRWCLQTETWPPNTPTVGWLDPARHETLARELGGRLLTPPNLVPAASPICLRPGDSLSIPRGWWHTSWSQDRSFSLTLTYVF